MAMAKPLYNSIIKHRNGKSVIVYVSSRRQAQLTAIDLMTYNENSSTTPLFDPDAHHELNVAASTFKEHTLQQVVKTGIGFVHGGMAHSDRNRVCSWWDG